MNKQYTNYIPECVFITGATGGFGQAMAHAFANIGCSLILHGRDKDKTTALCHSLKNVPTHPVIFDLLDGENTITQISNIPPDFQNIDLLINNAGGAIGLDKAQEAELQDWEKMIEMNCTSLVRITRQILPNMVTRQKGHIVNIGSMAGNYPYPRGNVYCAVKSFVKQFSLAIRADLQGTNVRVTNIEPGQAETPFSLARFKGDNEKAKAVYAGTKSLQAEDIAQSVLWSATLPPHVNINRMEIMPTCQAFGPLVVERDE